MKSSERERYMTLDDSDSHGMLRSTFICPAIHCPSCVSYIQSQLSLTPFRVPSSENAASIVHLKDITVSLIDRTISFSHPKFAESNTSTTAAEPPEDQAFTISLLRQVIDFLKKDGYSIDTVHYRDLSSSNLNQSAFLLYSENGSAGLGGEISEQVRDECEGTKARLIPELSKSKYKGYGSINPVQESQTNGSYPPPELKTGFLANLNRIFHPEQSRKEKELRERYQRHLQVCEACQDGKSHAGAIEPEPAAEESGESWEVKFAIGGMTCAACVSNVKSATDNVSVGGEKLLSFEVNLLSSSARAVVTSRSLIAAVVESIEDAGYEVEVLSTKSLDPKDGTIITSRDPIVFKAKFSIGGMTCASCVGNISQAVEAFKTSHTEEGKVELELFEVALLDSSATAKLKLFAGQDQKAVRAYASELLEAIEDSGYDTSLVSLEPEQGGTPSKDSSRRRTIRIKINGMFCDTCVHKVRLHLRSLSEDKSIHFSIPEHSISRFSLSSPEFECSYTPVLSSSSSKRTFTVREILSGLDSIDPAFSSEFISPPSLGKRSSYLARKELQSLITRLFIAFLFVVPTLVFGVIGPVVLASDHPLNQFNDKIIIGGATRSEILLWLLATPVEFGVGSIFWKRGWKGIKNVWRQDRNYIDRLFRWGDMNVLVALGTGVAYFSSLAFLIVDIRRGKPREGEKVIGMTYFDACIFLIFFILLGRVLESWSKRKTGDAVSQLGNLKPTHGLLLLDPSNPSRSDTSSTSVELLEIGDLVIIPSGSSPPLDASVSASNSETLEILFNEASLTGESKPSKKRPEDTLNVGTVNVSSSPVIARIEALNGQNMLDEILEVVRDASGKKANIEKLADKITGLFVPILVFVAIIVLAVWLLLLYSGFISEDWFNRNAPFPDQPGSKVLYAIKFSVSLLVVACPCGIGLAAPTAQMCGIGVASKLGVLVNGGGSSFEAAAKANKSQLVVIFDKTGTITHGGEGEVVDHALFDSDQAQLEEKTLWRCVSLVENQSTHPAAATLQAFCSRRGVSQGIEDESSKKGSSSTDAASLDLESVEELPGRGMKAVITLKSGSETSSRIELFVGNQRLLAEAKVSNFTESTKNLARNWQSRARSVVFVASRIVSSTSTPTGSSSLSPSLQAALAIADPIREEAAQTIQLLKKRFSAQVWMVSGDNEITARAVGKTVGIEEHRIIAGVLPTGKQEWVERLKCAAGEEVGESVHGGKSGSSIRTVAFVGDGINDSPAMVASHFSFAMAGGSSIAHSSADFILLSKTSPLLSIPVLLALSQATQLTILGNFVWAMLFNLSLVPIAGGALVSFGIVLGPSVSGLAMALSSTTVVLNALTLRLWSPSKDMTSP